MKCEEQVHVVMRHLHQWPLCWLRCSWRTRLCGVALSYLPAVGGLWLLFPPTHNGSTMFVPIILACWLFRYHGLILSLLFNGIAFQLSYLLFFHGLLSDAAFLGGALIGFGTSLAIGLLVCWLRTAVAVEQQAQQQVLVTEQERWRTVVREQQALQAYEQQRQINALKDQFLLNMNHEVRTPLMILAGNLELLRMYDGSLNQDKRAQILKALQAGQDELVALMDQVVEASHLISDIPAVRSTVLEVWAEVEQVLSTLMVAQQDAYRVHLRRSTPILVQADPQLLRQVLRNVFTNIFKYVPRDTLIQVGVTQLHPTGPVTLAIEDEGPGIPLDEQPELFEKCVRLKRDQGGPIRGSLPDPEWEEMSTRIRDSRRTKLDATVWATWLTLTYEYDLGDGWMHQITIERIEHVPDEARQEDGLWVTPRCLAGERACPPEDVGGAGGYASFLEAWRDPKDPEHEQMRTWAGNYYDPELFSVPQVNSALAVLE